MTHPVAPGKEIQNLLSKRYLYRAVILLGAGDDPPAIQGPLVLEAKDGSYKYSFELKDGTQDGDHLIFDFYVKDRDKEYECYLAGDSRRYRWKAIPEDPAGLDQIA
ncbi:MAG: hypothetical protein ABSE42_00115 [Bryobacteraceae bacterium]|jgi:hypothetical protein